MEVEIVECMGVLLQEFQQMLVDNNVSQMYLVDELQENYVDSWEISDEENEQFNLLNDVVRQNLMEWIIEYIQVIFEREQVLLQFYYLQDLNMKEIGLILGIMEMCVSQLYSLVVKWLRSWMELLLK